MAKPKPKTIRAVAYCRKSTNEERAEKSIADQKKRIAKMKPSEDGATYEIVRWYTKDKGVPGWKRGASRPDYFRLVNELSETKAKAILVDDMDRFSRADEMEVIHDCQQLREQHGVRYIDAVNQGNHDLAEDQFATMKIAMEAMASHAHSTRLSRRIANTRRDQALKGLRSGGFAPYGYRMAYENGKPVMPSDPRGKDDPKGCKLIFGDAKQRKTLKWIFEQFVTHCKSMNWIATQLNQKGIPASKGGKWYAVTIKCLLKERASVGDFIYNTKKSGQFHIVNGDGEVEKVLPYVDDGRKPWKATPEGEIVVKDNHKPLISRSMFNKAQRQLASFAEKSRKPRADGYPLSGVLVCGHCGASMTGAHPTGRNYRLYRCTGIYHHGSGACQNYSVREDLILPAVMKMLSEEIEDITKMLTSPPDELRFPSKERNERRKDMEEKRSKLSDQVKRATKNVMLCDDARSRKEMDKQLSKMRDELEGIESELETAEPSSSTV